MCLAVPMKVLDINGLEATVEIGEVRRPISVAMTPDVCEGDYVLVHAGFAIGVVDEDEALETLRLLHEMAEFYDEGTIASEMEET